MAVAAGAGSCAGAVGIVGVAAGLIVELGEAQVAWAFRPGLGAQPVQASPVCLAVRNARASLVSLAARDVPLFPTVLPALLDVSPPSMGVMNVL